MRRSRATAAGLLGLLLVLFLVWWLFRTPAAPAPLPPVDAAPAEPAPREEPPAPPPPAVPPAREELASASIRVLDAAAGDAVPESLVAVESAGGPPGPRLRASETAPGTWKVEGKQGTVVRLVATAPGRVPAERWLLLGLRAEIPVHLASTGNLAIRVTAAADGAPIPGAEVQVTGSPFLHPGANAAKSWTGRTDGGGHVSCPEAGPGRRLRIAASAPGFSSRAEEVDSARAALRIPLARGESPRLRVTDDRRAPIEGALVVSLEADGTPAFPESMTPRTGSDGEAEAPGACAVVKALGRGPCLVEGLRPGETREIRLAAATIGGVTIVGADGAALPGVPVRLLPLGIAVGKQDTLGFALDRAVEGVEALTDERGRVTVPAVLPNAVWSVIVGGAGELPLVMRTMHSRALPQWPELKIPVATPAVVEASSPEGLPFEGAEVLLVPPVSWEDEVPDPGAPLRRAAVVRTDAEGRARFLVPREEGPEIATAAGPLLQAFARGPRGDPLRVRFRPPGILQVGVVDRNGGPLAGALVRVRAAAGAGTLPAALRDRTAQEAMTGPDGAATFEVPEGATMEATAVAPDGLDAPSVLVGPGSLDTPARVALALARTGWIAVEDGEARRIPDAVVSISVDDLRAPWVLRGVTGPDGVLAVPLPSPDLPGAEKARAVVTVSGPAAAWAEVPFSSLIDGARIRVETAPRGLYLLLVEQDALWPRGTPFTWTLGPSRRGKARVGEIAAIFVGSARLDQLRILLPDAMPVRPESMKSSDALRSALQRESAAPPEKREEAAKERRTVERDNALRLSLQAFEVVNETEGWARALVKDAPNGPSVRTRALPKGGRARVLVLRSSKCEVTWEPLGSTPR